MGKINEREQKRTGAEERFAQKLNSIQEKAKVHNERAMGRAKALQAEEQREYESKQKAIEEKLAKAANKRADPSEKAREHNMKVQEKLYSLDSAHQETAN